MRTCAALLALTFVAFAETIAPGDVNILGDLDYGQSSNPVEYTGTPRYSAFLFPAAGGDRVEVTVTSKDRKAEVAIANGALKQLATGTSRLEFQIPNNGPDAEAYYILFRDTEGKSGKFTVELHKLTGK